MTLRLSDSQLTILAAACGREDGSVFPITAKLTGGALQKVLTSLLGKGLLEEVLGHRSGDGLAGARGGRLLHAQGQRPPPMPNSSLKPRRNHGELAGSAADMGSVAAATA